MINTRSQYINYYR